MENQNLPEAIQPVSQEQANAWISIAQQKNETVRGLSLNELAAQNLLMPLEQCHDYAIIDTALANYRKLHSETVELRKSFTSIIDANIIEPLMSFEKRMAYKSTVTQKGNLFYLTLEERSLWLRKEESKKVADQNAKNQEITNFKTHIQNEFSRVAMEYRNMVRRNFQSHYELMLTDRVADPSLEKAKLALRTIAPPPVYKFIPKYLTQEEMQALFVKEPPLNFNEIFADLVREMEKLFENYPNDLANAEAAIKFRADQAKLKEQEEEKAATDNQAMNTLLNTAESLTIEEPKIKKELKIVVLETPEWGKAVMAAFIVNLPQLGRYFRVKSWSKLNIGQMANYLSSYATDSGATFNNLKLEEVEK